MGENFSNLIADKITAVPGDITCEDLGIKETKLKEELLGNIDVIINLAATTNFDERYDVSLDLNTFGAKYVLNFAKKCPNLKVLVQVSTAYVSGETAGAIKETSYHMGHTLNGRSGLDIEHEKKLLHSKLAQLLHDGTSQENIKVSLKDMGMERARYWGWPNVYVFTKALAEMVLMQGKQDLPLVIIRPTIITSTFKEPFSGWVEGIRTIDSLAVAYGKGRLPCFLGDPKQTVDVIPGDMVVNAMIVAAAVHANEKGEAKIYHVGSSVRNPLKYTLLHEVGYHYFTKHPWINKDGEAVKVSYIKVLDSMDSFKRYMAIHYLLPLKGLEIANIAFCQYFKGTYMDLSTKIKMVMRLIDIYKPYLFFKGVYDDTNTEQLRIAASERGLETDIFYFDPKAVNWEDYVMNIHLPGLIKYVFK